jgi:hypothetical protein
MAHRDPAPAADEPTIGKLVVDASRDISTLVQSEIQLAKAELSVTLKTSVVAIALFAVAGFLALLSIIMVSVAIGYFIHMSGLDLAWCFLIVFGGYLLIAAVLALIGVRRIKKVRGPERALAQAKQIPGAFKH